MDEPTQDPEDTLRDQHYADFQRQLALDRFREDKPQLWLQYQRVLKLAEIASKLPDEIFPAGSCFVHANLVGAQTFCVKSLTGIDLDTCQVSLEVYGDDELEAGIVVLPLESVEWFGFPATAVPVGVHFRGFAPKE